MREPDDDNTRSHVPLVNGTMISHYRIVEKIGAGGMGEVYLALDTELDRKVALKFLPPHLRQDEECRIRFKREARAAAKLSHPNIVNIHEVAEYGGRPFIVMEYLHGKTLKEITESGDLPVKTAVALAIQVCEGIGKAHQADIVHRDIKPANIIVDEGGVAKILDFGLAAIKGDKKLTKTGSTLGTINYMSPEQTRGEAIDQRSDIFSLGVVLYEMITGRLPFKGDYEPAILYSIQYEEPEPLARYKSGVTDELQRIVSKALTKDVSLRYQTAADLLVDLKQLSLETKPVKRNKSWWWIAAAGIVAAVAIAGYLIAVRTLGTGAGTPEGWTNSVAVLVFRDLSPNKDQDYFCEGMTDEIIGRLSAIKQLKVTSMQSVLRFKNTATDLKRIGSELGVNNILEGSIQRDKDSIRVSAQLIRVNDDAHIWSDRYYHEAGGVFVIQDDIAHSIANVLEATLVGEGKMPAARKGTDNLEAYNEYMLGRFFWRKRTEKDLWTAATHFEKAVALDPNYAPPYSGLADVWLALPNYGRVNHGDAYPKADSASRKAVELDDNSAEAHASRGNYLRNIGDYPGADREFRRAIDLSPGYSWTHVWYDLLLSSRGETKEGTRHLQIAYELDPLSVVVLGNLAARSRQAGDPDNVERYAMQAIAIERNYKQAYQYLALSYAELRRDTIKAFETANALVKELPDDWYSWSTMGLILNVFGRTGEAYQAYRKAVEIAPDYWEAHRLFGEFLMNSGRMQEAAKELKLAAELGTRRAEPLLSYAWLLAQMGRTAEALDLNRRAVEAVPYDAEANRAYGWLLGVHQGKYKEAIKYMLRAIELNPRSIRAYNSLSLMYANTDNYDSALWAINKSMEISPADPFAQRRKADIFTIAGRFDSALVWYRQYRQLLPNEPYAVTRLHEIYTVMGRYAEADSIIQILLTYSDSTQHGWARYYALDSLFRQGKIQEAIQRSQNNIDVDRVELGNSSPLIYEYIRRSEYLLAFLDNPTAALADLEKTDQACKKTATTSDWDAVYIKGVKAVAIAASGEIQKAITTLQRELDRTNPENSTVLQGYYSYLAWVHRLAGDFERSAKVMEKAVAIDSNFCGRLYLGVCYLRLGRADEAVNMIEKAMSRYDDNRLASVAEAVTGYYYLAQAYEAVGRTADAIKQYEIFLDIWKNADPELKEVTEAKARLARLQSKL